MSASSALWAGIESALTRSRYFILVASSESAKSKWVHTEVDFWLRNRGKTNFLIALTDGEIEWDDLVQDFDWAKTTALPGLLRGVFSTEPQWVDFRWSRAATGHILSHPSFRECVATLGATLHGRPKDELIGEDLRQMRRARFYRAFAVALLVILAGVASWGWYNSQRNAESARRQEEIAVLNAQKARQHEMVAISAQRRAEQERDSALRSESLHLADAALRQMEEHNHELAILLALEGLPRPESRRPYVAEAEATLMRVMTSIGARRISALEGHRDPAQLVNHAAFSPDGTRLLTASHDGTIRVWDARNGKQFALLKADQGSVWFAAFRHGGSQIVAASSDGALRLWDSSTGKLGRVIPGHESTVVHLAVGPRELIATASADNTAKVWDAATGRTIATLLGHSLPLTGVQINPNGTRVATVSVDGTARLWNLSTGRPIAVFKDLPRRLGYPMGETMIAKFSPDGRFLITSQEDNQLRFWDAEDGSPVTAASGHSGVITSAAFSSTGRWLATASLDGTVRIWDVEHLGPAPESKLVIQVVQGSKTPLSTSGVKFVAFSPDGAFVATTCDSGQACQGAQLWDASTGKAITQLPTAEAPFEVAIAPDSRRIVTVAPREIALWENLGPKFGRTWQESAPVSAVAVNDNSNRLLSAVGNTVMIKERDTGRLLGATSAHRGPVTFVVFEQGGRRFITVSRDGTARIWNSHNGALIALLGRPGKAIKRCTFSPTGDRVATASEDGAVALWDLAGRQIAVLADHTAAVEQVSFSGDGRRIITASADGTARVWDSKIGSQVSLLRAQGKGIRIAVLSPSGETAITVGSDVDSIPTLWDVATRKPLHVWKEQRSGSVLGVEFSRDGRSALIWDFMGRALLWSTGPDYQLRVGFNTGCPLIAASMTRDGSRVVTVSKNSRVESWDTLSGVRLLSLWGLPDNPECDSFGARLGNREIASAGFGDSPGDVAGLALDGTAFYASLPMNTEEAVRLARQMVPRKLTSEERDRFHTEH